MKWFVTAGNRLNHVDVYRWDGKDLKLAKRIATGKTPSHIWIDSTSTTAYVTMQDSDELIAVDLPTQDRQVAHRHRPDAGRHLRHADDKTLLVGLTGSDGVEVFDVAGASPSWCGKIPTGKPAPTPSARPATARHVFVSNRVANTISKIDLATLKVVANYAAPGGPDCMDVSADGKTLYVTSRWAKKLTVIDTETRRWCGRSRWAVAARRLDAGPWQAT
jgi:DNA-binding beta-propeller fold protein YncE